MIAIARILIVEDERIVATEFKRRLTRLGYEVVSITASGEAAVAEAQLLHPDLVLMDVGLQGSMTGIEAGARIHSHLHIPVVYVTAHPMDQEIPHVSKPVDDRQLRAMLMRVLGRG
jgi:CheY-like chemotaxis protein